MRAKSDIIWADGKLMLEEHFRIPALAPGLAQGLGCFETLLAIRGRCPFFKRHWERLSHAAERLELELPEGQVVAEAINQVLEENALDLSDRARVRLSLMALDGQGRSSLSIAAIPARPQASSLSATLLEWRRNENSPLTGLKALSYAENRLALRQCQAAGFDEGIFLNSQGQLCEGTMSNLFLVKGGVVLTPGLDSGCLPGITRSVLLELSQACDIPCQERALDSHEIFMADEVWLSNSLIGLCPLHRLDQRELSLGPLGARLQTAYQELLHASLTPHP